MQFGFRQNISTAHALINVTENIRQALDEGYIGCGILAGLQKAFDTVDHEFFLSKRYGIRGVSNDWFRSYHSDYEQHVSINGYDSGLSKLSCGVPQGSVLGPLLFLLYINDLNQAITFCKVHHFEDDTNLLHLGKSIKKLNKFLSIDLKNLVNWLNANKISLNVKKTGMVIFKSKRKKFNDTVKIKLSDKRIYHLQVLNTLVLKLISTLLGSII